MSRVISSIGRGLLACVIVAFVACGGGSGEQQAADTAQQAPATGQAANPMAEMAKAMGGSGDMKPVDPVDFTELQTLLPEISGWQKWNRNDKSGEVHALVGKRFLMHVEGENLGGIKELHQVVQQADLKKLEGMR